MLYMRLVFLLRRFFDFTMYTACRCTKQAGEERWSELMLTNRREITNYSHVSICQLLFRGTTIGTQKPEIMFNQSCYAVPGIADIRKD